MRKQIFLLFTHNNKNKCGLHLIPAFFTPKLVHPVKSCRIAWLQNSCKQYRVYLCMIYSGVFKICMSKDETFVHSSRQNKP